MPHSVLAYYAYFLFWGSYQCPLADLSVQSTYCVMMVVSSLLVGKY